VLGEVEAEGVRGDDRRVVGGNGGFLGERRGASQEKEAEEAEEVLHGVVSF
jgi:hypothetical protein